jgi:hypothetical protein
MTERKPKPMTWCHGCRLFHAHDHKCWREDIVNQFEVDRKAGKNPPAINWKELENERS